MYVCMYVCMYVYIYIYIRRSGKPAVMTREARDDVVPVWEGVGRGAREAHDDAGGAGRRSTGEGSGEGKHDDVVKHDNR